MLFEEIPQIKTKMNTKSIWLTRLSSEAELVFGEGAGAPLFGEVAGTSLCGEGVGAPVFGEGAGVGEATPSVTVIATFTPSQQWPPPLKK